MKSRTLLPALLSCLLASTLLADGLIIVEPPHPAPTPRPNYTPLAVKNHHVTVTIRGQVAVTEIDQVFVNPSSQRLEGTYLFPIPKGAQLDEFTMDVNGEMTPAELLDADKARQIYEDIVRQMKDPALLEYVGTGMFKARIFPIEPNSEKRVTLKYTQVLHRDRDMVDYLYPLNTEKFSSKPLESVSVKVDIQTDQAIRSVWSPSHEVEVSRHDGKHVVVGYEAGNVKPSIDFQVFYELEPSSEDGVSLSALMYNDGHADGGYFVLLASPGKITNPGKVLPKDVVFVLDTSGSMEGRKLDQAKQALRFCLANLNGEDRFEVVRFSTESEPLFGDLAAANEGPLSKARQFVDGMKPMGGTAIEEALLEAVDTLQANDEDDNRPAVVIFLTDGKPTVGNTKPDSIVRKVTEKVKDESIRIFSFGIGTSVNTHLLDKITSATRAYSQYVLPEEDIEVKVSRFYRKIASPVLADLELQAEGIRITKTYPTEMPDLFEGDQLVVFGRYTGSGEAALTVTGQARGKKQRIVNELNFPGPGALKHAFIPRLWAGRRVGYLLDQIRLHGESDELKNEVTALARQYGIVTPYTSYLILEDEARRDIPVAQRTLNAIERDRAAREEAEASASLFGAADSGDDAVAGARAGGKLRADNLAKQAEATREAARPLSAPADASGITNDKYNARRKVAQQQARFVRGRAFYQNGSQWIDSNVQSKPDADVVQVTFNSDDYFELMDQHPDAVAWLSVGRNVQLLLNDTVYEVID